MKNILDFDFMVELFLEKRKKIFLSFFEKKMCKNFKRILNTRLVR